MSVNLINELLEQVEFVGARRHAGIVHSTKILKFFREKPKEIRNSDVNHMRVTNFRGPQLMEREMNLLKKLKAQQDRFAEMQLAFDESFRMAEPIVKEALIELLKKQPGIADEATFKLVLKQFSREKRQMIELYLYGLTKGKFESDSGER